MHIVSRVGIGKVPPSSPLYLDVGGAVNFDSTLHVIGQTTVNSLISSQLSSNSPVYESRIAGENNALFFINRDGILNWGDGGFSLTDVNLYRASINTLRTNGSLIIDNSLIVGDLSSDTATFIARISSDFDPSINNLYNLGQDSLRWKNLWLGTKLTSVDGLFTGDLQVDGNTILGDSNTDTLVVNAFVNSQLTPFVDNLHNLGSLTNRWKSLFLGSDLKVDGNTILGDTTSDTVTVNARVASILEPSTDNSFDLGSLLIRWRSLFLGSDLKVDGNTILGDSNTDTLVVNAFVNSQLTPFVDNLHNLGSLTNRWKSLFLGSDLQVDGNTILGNSPSDTVTVNAGISSAFNPHADNLYNLGTSVLRWKNIDLGPEGIVVRNDNTDTEKVSLFFNNETAFLNSSSTVNLILTTGTNTGLIIDTLGNVGVNTTSLLNRTFNVNGTSDFSDTVYFSKLSGYGFKVSSVAGIEGSIESANADKILNIGVNTETEFINLGTGSLTKTVNIGTGSGKTTINIGGPSDIININGTVTATQTIESFVTDKTFSLNVGGLNGTAQNSGLVIEEASSIFLTVSDPTWQSGNTVRYLSTDTGNIQVGSVVLISGFSTINNGQFTVTALSSNNYIEIQNAQINNSSFDEIGFNGSCSNPSIAAKILISSDRNSWEFFSPSNISNHFKLTNLGANAELKSTIDGLAVASIALIPDIDNTPLGLIDQRWSAFLSALTVSGNSIIGRVPTIADPTINSLTINAITQFVEKIDSDIIPNQNATFALGSISNRWQNLYTNNLNSYVSSSLEGAVYLGSDETTIIAANGRFSTNLVPNSSSLTLGTTTNPWDTVFVNTIKFPSISEGSVLFINDKLTIAGNNDNFFWDNNYKKFNIGLNDGEYVLDIKKYQADSVRITNSQNNSSVAFRTKETIFNETTFISNGPAPVGSASIAINAVNKKIAQTFTTTTTKNIQKVSVQLSVSAPTAAPSLKGKLLLAIHSVSGGVINATAIAKTAPLILDTFPIGFQTAFTDFVFFEMQTLPAGTYAIVIETEETPNFGTPGYLTNCIKIVIPGIISADPAPAGFSSIPVEIYATDSIQDVVNKTTDALNAITDFSVSPISNVIKITNSSVGTTNDASDADANVVANIITQGDALTAEVSEIKIQSGGFGLDSTVAKYWLLNSANDATSYYVWYNVTDGFNGCANPNPSSVVTITNTSNGITTNATNVDAGVSINILTEGDVSTAEVTKITMPSDTSGLDGATAKHWLLNSANDATSYYVWYNVTDGSGTADPLISGLTGIQVDILLADSSSEIALKTANAINVIGDFSATKTDFVGIQIDVLLSDLAPEVAEKTKNILDALPEFDVVRLQKIQIQNTSVGSSTDANNVNAGVMVNIVTQGSVSVQEMTELIFSLDGSGLNDSVGKYWTIYSANDANSYYIWYKVSNPSSSLSNGDLYTYNTSWSQLIPAQDICLRIYEKIDSSASIFNKFEFTEKIQFGANTYANVGNGLSTPVFELSDTAISLLGAVSHTTTSVSSATYVVTPTDTILYVDTSISGCTITLPSAATKRLLIIKDIGNAASASGRSIELIPASGQYIEFNSVNTPFTIDSDGASLTIHSNGSDRWYII